MTVPRSMRDLETTGDFGCKINKDAPSFIRNAEAAGSNPVTPIDEMLYKTANEPVLLAHYLFILYILICLFVEYIPGR